MNHNLGRAGGDVRNDLKIVSLTNPRRRDNDDDDEVRKIWRIVYVVQKYFFILGVTYIFSALFTSFLPHLLSFNGE